MFSPSLIPKNSLSISVFTGSKPTFKILDFKSAPCIFASPVKLVTPTGSLNISDCATKLPFPCTLIIYPSLSNSAIALRTVTRLIPYSFCISASESSLSPTFNIPDLISCLILFFTCKYNGIEFDCD